MISKHLIIKRRYQIIYSCAVCKSKLFQNKGLKLMLEDYQKAAQIVERKKWLKKITPAVAGVILTVTAIWIY